MNIPKIGDRVDATMNGEDYFRGELVDDDSKLFCEYGVLTDFHKEIRYFVSIRPVCEECEKKDNEIKTLHETIDRLNKEIEDMKYNQWEADMGEDL